ncbi:hypothetical protein [Cryobacterium zongtaii]|uniref:hypothetical protein n=1 Tax=Cryobacterium zongtaii TaxID=1259217 RepID=UPI001056F3F4|nr:hypothetical protein [Cryobacterium zongtaii]
MTIPVVYWYLPLPEPVAWPELTAIALAVPAYARIQSVSIMVKQFKWSSRIAATMDDLFDAMKVLQPPTIQRDEERRNRLETTEVVTVLELAVEFPRNVDLTENAISDAFDLGLAGIQDLQRAYALATQHPIELLTRELLPPMVPTTTRIVTDRSDGWPGAVGIFLANSVGISALALPEPLTEQQNAAFRFAFEAPDTPFATYADLRRESAAALRLRGDSRSSTLASATAAEVFLDTLLLHLLWEEGSTAEAAARLFTTSIARRVRSQYAQRLGGIWNCMDATTPPGAWLELTANVRNRLIHAGVRPTRADAETAYRATIHLERYAADLLCGPTRLPRYSRTALALVGDPGLIRRGVQSATIAAYRRDEEDADWGAEFTNWRSIVAAERLVIQNS